MTRKTICSCAKCHATMFEGDDLVQNFVYKCGDLQYIELAHRTCLPEWAVNDDHVPPADSVYQPEPAPFVYVAPVAPSATFADLWPA